jgi:hypothetical protein
MTHDYPNVVVAHESRNVMQIVGCEGRVVAQFGLGEKLMRELALTE